MSCRRGVLFFVIWSLCFSVKTGLSVQCGIAQLRGKRDQMEDRALCICPFIKKPEYPHICFLAVFDGHEGSEVSQYLANHLHRNIQKAILQSKASKLTPEFFEQLIHEQIEKSEKSLFEKVKLKQIASDVGSTATIALIVDEEYAMIANVGNSRALLCTLQEPLTNSLYDKVDCDGLQSQLLFSSNTHSPDVDTERKRIESTGSKVTRFKGIWRIDNGLEISRSVGDWQYKTKGVVSSPETSHVLLPTAPWSILLISDGISDQIKDQEVCQITQEIQHGCPLRNKTQRPDPPIALSGFSPPHLEGHKCDGSRLGLDLTLFPETSLLGLKGCTDCITHVTCAKHMIPSQLLDRSDFGSIENRIASTLIEEAQNRRASDNLAVVLLHLQKFVPNRYPVLPMVSRAVSGGVIKSEQSRDEGYQLVAKMMEIPRPKRNPLHNKWLQPIQNESIQPETRCEAGSLGDDRQSLMIFTPSDDRSPETEWELIGSSKESSVSCMAPYQLDSVNEQLLYILGTLPFQDGVSRTTKRRLQSETEHPQQFIESFTEYQLGRQFAGGGFGDIWKAHRSQDEEEGETGFILKRLKSTRGEEAFLSGLREAYFGSLFQQSPSEANNHLVRFVESFELDRGEEMWLVFRDEGVSLHSLMYSARGEDGAVIVEPSSWWRKLRKSEQNEVFERRLIQQLLKAVSLLHSKNTTHRDIKPENVLIEGTGEPDPSSFTLRLIDFGSAIDEVSMRRYYGETGPSDKEQTKQYAPPEALFEKLVYDADLASHYYAYDMWSIGILWLEYIMGTPHVFQLSHRTRSKLEVEFKRFKLAEEDKEKAYLLRALMEFCIYPPGNYKNIDQTSTEKLSKDSMKRSLISWSCSEEFLFRLLKTKDLNSVGISSRASLRLLMSLLAWNPYDRVRAKDALDSEVFRNST